MNVSRMWTITRLDLTQRIRTVSWFVMLGVFAVMMLAATMLAFTAVGTMDDAGPAVYSTVVFLALLLIVLVSPTLSGNSINGDRDAATLASLQITQATTTDILLGKFLAAWITGLAFAVLTIPFLIFASLAGGVNPLTVVVSAVVLVIEAGIIAGFGTALSGIMARPLFSVATTYLVVSALALGTVIGFGLVGASITTEQTYRYQSAQYDPATGEPLCRDGVERCWNDPEDMICDDWQSETSRIPRFDRVWWMLAPNPFVILADATPAEFDRNGYPIDLFGWAKSSVRSAQLPPDDVTGWSDCDPELFASPQATSEEVVASTAPSWFVGLGLQLALAAALMVWAGLRTRTPARKLPPGTRIA